MGEGGHVCIYIYTVCIQYIHAYAQTYLRTHIFSVRPITTVYPNLSMGIMPVLHTTLDAQSDLRLPQADCLGRRIQDMSPDLDVQATRATGKAPGRDPMPGF